MFKFVYQAFMMLSLVSAYSMIKFALLIRKNIAGTVFVCIGIVLFILVSMYPYFAISSYYGNLSDYKGLDGISYLKQKEASDYDAIIWINNSVVGNPILLEAQGDSYTDYGRISANTGLPTVLGWTVHEWLWRKSYDVPAPRITEIQTLYESADYQETISLLRKYNISYVYIGELEKQKYPNLNEEKFQELGTIVYANEKVKIYRVPRLL